MRFSTILTTLAAAVPLAQAVSHGFNVGATNPDGSCKSTSQWAAAFKKLKTLPQKFNTVRLYASSDCGTLANAVPAALSTNTKILVGVWTEDATHYANEKKALQAAIKAHGHDWILAISVGSEDLYRGDTTAATLAGQIKSVRTMVRGMGVTQPVGHVDTWNAWTNGANAAVVSAVDFVGMDAYPYFQNTAIGSAASTFNAALTATKKAAKGKPVWITETGWPVSGPASGAAVPSVANAKTYFNQVYCQAAKSYNIFWYAYQDYNASPSFGVFNQAGKSIYDTAAC